MKELEQLLQSLEAQKLQLQQQQGYKPFPQFFVNPQYTWSQMPNKYSIADIEVTLIETHANLRILSRRRTPSHITHLISGLQSLFLTILHINATSLHPLVLYSISAKVRFCFVINRISFFIIGFDELIVIFCIIKLVNLSEYCIQLLLRNIWRYWILSGFKICPK